MRDSPYQLVQDFVHEPHPKKPLWREIRQGNSWSKPRTLVTISHSSSHHDSRIVNYSNQNDKTKNEAKSSVACQWWLILSSPLSLNKDTQAQNEAAEAAIHVNIHVYICIYIYICPAFVLQNFQKVPSLSCSISILQTVDTYLGHSKSGLSSVVPSEFYCCYVGPKGKR